MYIDSQNIPEPYQSLDENGYILDVNDQWTSFLGYDRHEVIGTYFGDFLSVNEKPLFKQRFEDFKQAGAVKDVVFLLRHKDGHYIACDYDGKITKNKDGKVATQCLFHDHKKLVQFENYFKEVFEYSNSAIVIFEPYNDGEDFIFVDVNKRVEEIEGLRQKEIINKKVTEVFPSVKDMDIFQGFQRAYQTGQTQRVPVTLYENEIRVGYRSNTIIKLPSNQLMVVYDDESKLEYSRRMLNATVNTIENIVLTTIDGENLDWCNDYTLNVLGFDSIEDFKSKYRCICDLFIEDAQDNCIGSEINGQNWVKYALHHKNTKTKINTLSGQRYFHIQVSRLHFDAKNRYVVILNDITDLQDSINELQSSKDFIQKSYESIMHTFVNIMEEKDVYTAGHSKRVAQYSRDIAEAMDLPESDIDTLFRAGQLHDIGKIITPESVLLKPGSFSSDEFALMKEHAKSGAQILGRLSNYETISKIVQHHHERYDGTGYPDGLQGAQIPLLSRIMTLADAFDAMTTNRVYKPRMTVKDAVKEVQRCGGTHFDPEIVPFAAKYFSNITHIDNKPSIPTDVVSRHRFAYFFKDSLTNAYNGDYLEVFLKNNQQERLFHSAYFFDLHRLHQYNRKYGWEEGDKILQMLANLIQEKSESDMVFRLRGDKFIVLHDSPREIDFSLDSLPDGLFVTTKKIEKLELSITDVDQLMNEFESS